MTEEELVYRLRVAYAEAISDLSKKIDKYLKKFEKKDAEMRALYDSGVLSHEDYMSWRFSAIAGSKQWEDMRSQLTFDMVHVDQIASDIINDAIPEMYAEGHNYGTYEAEIGSGWDTTYTLYNRDTVALLMEEGKIDLLPVNLDIPRDEQWNRQHIQSAITQGILQGEPMQKIADRLQSVVGMDERAAIRNARTAVTGAQNAGHVDSYIRAEKMGIKLKQMWIATLDGRTRDSHAMLDGQQREVGKEFSNGCRYPGDARANPSEIWNCRCRLVAMVEGADPYSPDLRPSKYLKDQGLTYDEWKRMHEERYDAKLLKESEVSNSIIFSDGEEAKKYFGIRPERSLRRSDRAEYDRQMEIYNQSSYGQWYNKLSPNQIGSIGEYCGDGYIPMNGLLRHQMTEKMVKAWNGTYGDTLLQDMIGEVESAIKDFELRDPIKVYRTCENDVLENLNLKIGTRFHDDGFGSTCVLKEKVASGNIFMEIDIPKGKGYGAWVNPLSGGEDKEWEFLLQRGTDYLVKDIRYEGADTIISLEVLGNTRNDWSFATKEEVIALWKKRGIYDEKEAERI